MKRLLRCAVVLLLCGRAASVAADPTERVLLPIVIEEPVAGAYGSLWETHIALVNTGPDLAFVYGIETGCPLPECPGANAIAPGATLFPHALALDRSRSAHLLEVSNPNSLAIQITVQDRSRALLTWGTSVPAIREADAHSAAFQLLDVPAAFARFRSLLRVYSFSSTDTVRARIRFYRTNPAHDVPYEPNEPDALLGERVLDIIGSDSTFTPGYAALPLSDLPEIPAETRLRIEVAPEGSETKLWAMVSVTNNDTQHVTIITPD